jgi:UPF0716 protein FxsA
MFGKLLLVFLLVPLAEIMLFIEIGSRIGTWMTLLIVVLTAVCGTSLAQRTGLQIWWRLQEKLSQGRMPNEELLDGALVLLAGALLLTPGFLTDIMAILLLYTKTRQGIKRWLRRYFSQRWRLQYRQWQGGWEEASREPPESGTTSVRGPGQRWMQ